MAAAGFMLLGGKEEPKETVRVSGAWALYPMMVRWADEYQKSHDVRIEVSAGGAGKGMADALSGLVEIGMVSRDIDPSETGKGAYGIRVAKDAVIPTMNRKNPMASEIQATGLKKSQFQSIFINGTGVRWGDLAGKPGESNKVQAYTRSDSCGAAEIWAKFLGAKQEDLSGVGVNADPGIAEAVSKDAYGMGYNNLNFAYDPKSGDPFGDLMMVPIDFNEDGKIDETESFYAKKADMAAAIADGRYKSPPSRDLYVVTKGKPAAASSDFLKWILTDGQQYVTAEGYIPLKSEVLSEEVKGLG